MYVFLQQDNTQNIKPEGQQGSEALTAACNKNVSKHLQMYSRYWALNVLLASRLDISGVTWRHRSRDHSIPRRPISIGGTLEPSL